MTVPDDGSFRALVENSTDAIMVHDGRRILYANPRAARLVDGPSPGALVGEPLLRFIRPQDHAATTARIDALLSGTGSPPFLEGWFVRWDGSPLEAEIQAMAVRFAGRPAIQLVARELTERRRAEAALADSQQQLERVLASTNIALFSLEPTPPFHATYVSPNTLLGTGHGEHSLDDPAFAFDQIHPDDREAVGACLVGESDRERSTLEYRWRKADGTYLHAQTEIHRVRGPDGALLRLDGVALDVTERKWAEAEIREKEAQLRQAAKMEAVGRLAGGIAHDFNNLLTVINSYAAMLVGDLEAEAASDAAEILAAGERAAALTRQLLAFSRKSVIDPRVLQLDRLVVEMQKLLTRTLGEQVSLVLCTEPVWPVKADPSHLEQVVMNLALNARDAMPDGGTVTLALSNVPAQREHGDRVLLSVRDTGVGIEPEMLSHIFEPFFTTKAAERGTGLGLATVHGNVTRSGGTVEVESTVGRGTTFRVYLPRTEESVPADAPRPPTVGEGQGRTVLLVEDEATVRLLTNRLLTRAGYAVIEATTGEDAIALYRTHAARIDLVLTDVVMPEVSGTAVAEALWTLRPNQPILFMSGHTDAVIAPKGLLQPGVRLLHKPFTAPSLLEAVERALRDAPPRR